MLHQVQFGEAWSLVIPIRKGADGNLVLEQGTELGAATPPFSGTSFGTAEPIHGGRTDGLEPLKTRWADAQVLPFIQALEFGIHSDAEAFGTNLVEEFRQPQDGAYVFRKVDPCAGTTDGNLGITVLAFAAQERHRVFSMIVGRGDELIKDAAALLLARAVIAFLQLVQILFGRFAWGHWALSFRERVCPTIQSTSISVTFSCDATIRFR